MRKLVALFLFAAVVLPLRADSLSDGIRADLARERRRASADARGLAETTRRLETALAQAALSARSVSDGAARTDVGLDEISRREEALGASEQEVRSLFERRRLLADRIVERRRSIAAFEAELALKKPGDALTGRWAVVVEPGEQRGLFRINLDGTLVTGEYSLEGGYTGSLRGTLVNDRLRVERVDSKLGFSTVYFGRVGRDGSLAGTWEATTFGTGGPGSGRWQAVRDESSAAEEPQP
ncbi:MAG: hypothetical protein ABI592_15810 [Acidobacteriota bacterium]